MDRGFTVILKDQVPVASPLSCAMTAESDALDIMSSFENRKEPFDHIFCSRHFRPYIAHPPLSASEMRQYSTQDASLVVMCRFNVGKGMHG
jgi:hypothetical protein